MKIKRFLALTGAILLFSMYGCTLIFALMEHPASKDFLKAAIACTIILPVLLYGYTLVYRVTKDFSHDAQDLKENGDNHEHMK